MPALKTPIIVVNFKTYPEACGSEAIALARECEAVAEETGLSFAVAPPMADLASVAGAVGIPVISQHMDDVRPGSTTGQVPPEGVAASGAVGTLLNHSERRMRIAHVGSLVTRCRTAGLTTIVCTNDIGATKACAAFEPDFVAIEPPELIGGDISVTTANPSIVEDSVSVAHRIHPDIKVLCGAGVKNGADVSKAIELGTDGILLASGVVKASDRNRVLLDLASGIGR